MDPRQESRMLQFFRLSLVISKRSCSHQFSREATITASNHINDEGRIFAVLLLLAPLFCPNPAEEELRGVNMRIRAY